MTVEIINRPTFNEIYERGRKAPHLFARDFLGIECHLGQIAWLNRATYKDADHPEAGLKIVKPTSKEGALSAANRFGKSHVQAIKLLHRAFYQIRPDDYKFDSQGNLKTFKAVSIAMSLDQAMLTYNYALAWAKGSERFARFVIDEETVGTPFPKLTIGMITGPKEKQWKSQIWARSTAKRARFLLGHTFNIISWDEAAFDPAMYEQEVLDKVIRPRLFDEGGDLDFVSAPNGYNRFKEVWDMGMSPDPYYYSFTGNVFLNYNPRTGKPNVDVESIKRAMRKMNPEDVTQNIWGLFAKFTSIFPPHVIQQCYRDQEYNFNINPNDLPGMLMPPNYIVNEKTVDNGAGEDATMQTYAKSKRKLRYVVAADLARKKDFTCIICLQLPENDGDPMRMVYYELLNKVHWREIWKRVALVCKTYNDAPIMVDSTGIGDPIIATLEDHYDLKPYGYHFSGPTKENAVLQCQQALQNKGVVFPFIRTLVNQLTYYKWEDKKLETDAVMSLSLAVEMARVFLGQDAFDALFAPDLLYVMSSNRSRGGVILPDDINVEDDLDLIIPNTAPYFF